MSTVATVHSEPLGSGRAPRYQLVVIDGRETGRAVLLAERAVVVGTDAGCDLVLTDERVSGRHLQIERDGAAFRAIDLDSTNGTIFEGSAIKDVHLPLGATLKLGRTFLRLQPEPQPLEVRPSQARRFGELVGQSLAMREVFAVLELTAASDVTVLLEGETGTGKELAARALHDASARRRGPFVAIDCGALPESLVDSELFGHVRGAFTGASTERLGAFARADKGTLFLDELDAVPSAVQARLLRVIEERLVRPLGADTERRVDVRIVAASRCDLSTRVADGSFRPDLFYRLSVVRIVLPPLRARREDIAPIVHELMSRHGLDPGKVAGANLDRLLAQPWPGNVRQLRNAIHRAIALSADTSSFAALRFGAGEDGDSTTDPLAVRSDLPFADAKQAIITAFERRYLRDVFERCGGNITATARAADLDRKHLRTLLRRHGIVATDVDDGED